MTWKQDHLGNNKKYFIGITIPREFKQVTSESIPFTPYED